MYTISAIAITFIYTMYIYLREATPVNLAYLSHMHTEIKI